MRYDGLDFTPRTHVPICPIVKMLRIQIPPFVFLLLVLFFLRFYVVALVVCDDLQEDWSCIQHRRGDALTKAAHGELIRKVFKPAPGERVTDLRA